MAVRRQITVYLIVCWCAHIINTGDLADRSIASTALPGEESSTRSKMETGNLTGKITAHKNGAKLELEINTKVIWKKVKNIDSKTCARTVEQKGERGDKGDRGPPGIEGKEGERGNNGIDGQKGEQGVKGDKGEIGPPGIEGKKAEKGDNGIDGQKGDKGDPGICQDSYGERGTNDYGSKGHPAYSCSDIPDDGTIYVNPANGFQVSCHSYKSCVPNLPKGNNFNELKKNDQVWLSDYKLDLKNFYKLKISKLWYLLTTNEGFRLTLEYSNEVEILEILSWNGLTVKTKPALISKGCKVTVKEETKTRLDIDCKPANYLPMDFLVKTSTENILIQLLSLCFY